LHHGDRGPPRRFDSRGHDRRGAHARSALCRHSPTHGSSLSLLDKFAPLRALQAALGGERGLPPVATPMDEVHSATEATIGGRRVLLAGTNNYLGLTFDPACRAAAIAAIESLGTGTTGSRMASGNYAGHRDLERALADAFGWP